MDGAVDGALDGASEKGLNGAPGRLSGGNDPVGKAQDGVLDPIPHDCRSPLTMEKPAVPKATPAFSYNQSLASPVHTPI